jgi:hypothetical protein
MLKNAMIILVGAAGFEPAKTLYNMAVSLIIIIDTAR